MGTSAANLLANVAPDDRHLVASGIVSAFNGIWRDSWFIDALKAAMADDVDDYSVRFICT